MRRFLIHAPIVSAALFLVLGMPTRSLAEPIAHPVAPDHLSDEDLSATVPDGAGGAYIGFRGRPAFLYDPPGRFVAHIGPDGMADPSWTVVELQGFHPQQSAAPVAIAPGRQGRVWVGGDLYFASNPANPLARAVGELGATVPDSSITPGHDFLFLSLTALPGERVFIAGTQSMTAGIAQVGYIEADGTPIDAPSSIQLPGPLPTAGYFGPGPPAIPDGAGGAWVVFAYNVGDNQDQGLCAARIGPAGGSVIVPALRNISTTASNQEQPVLAPDGVAGLFVAWTDRRDLTKAGDIYCTHLLADGSLAPGWPLQGRAIASIAGDQLQPSIAADGSGGAWIAWTDSRTGADDIYFTHIAGDGTPRAGFVTGGKPLCAAPGIQDVVQAVADGEGGIYAVWLDQRNGGVDLFGQHIHSTGVIMPGWAADGLPISTEASDQSSPSVVLSSLHHALATWTDRRTGYPKVYAAVLPPDGETTAVPPPVVAGLSLAPVANPSRGGVELRVSSPEDGPVRVTLLDVSGRVRAEQVIEGPVRDQRVRFDAPGPGLFFLRAEQRGALASGRVAVVR